MFIIDENLQKMVFNKAKLVKKYLKNVENVETCWMLGILTKMLKCCKMLIQKLNILTNNLLSIRSLKNHY